MRKILIISRTPWNNSNSFGNTFSNLFGGMEGVSIYNICCQSGSSANDVVKKTLQMSDTSVLKSIIGKPIELESTPDVGPHSQEKIVNVGKLHRSTFAFLIRDLIWFVGRRNHRKAIAMFIDNIKPDVIYLPIYASWYMCNIDLFAIKYAKVPVVGHITDDIYGIYPGLKKTSGEYWYRKVLQKKERKIISKLSYIEVFADNMKKEYEHLFSKPCFVIGKGITPEEISEPQYHKNTPSHFVYTGGIAGERFEVLLLLGKALLENECFLQSVLDIYSATPLTEKMRRELDAVKTINFHGAVDGRDVIEIQKKADFLVHVEGFSQKSVFENKMSFSTKIIDYLATGKTLVAIGPRQINSINLIVENKMGLVVDAVDDIVSFIHSLASGEIDTTSVQKNAYNYLLKNRLKTDIQNSMLSRINKL